MANPVNPAQFSPDRQSLLPSNCSLFHLAGKVALIGSPFEQICHAFERERGRTKERSGIMSSSFTMCSLCRCLPGRQRCIVSNQFLIMGTKRVMDQTSKLGGI